MKTNCFQDAYRNRIWLTKRNAFHFLQTVHMDNYATRDITKLMKTQSGTKQSSQNITGYIQTTSEDHLHGEAQILPLQTHVDMSSTQFIAGVYDSTNPWHPLTNYPSRPRKKKKNTPALHFGHLCNQIFPHQPIIV